MEFIGPNGDIAVPDRFYKVIVRRRTFRPESVEGIAVIYGQDPGANPPAFCPIDEVEELTGFDFHPRVAEEISAGFESRVRDLSWGGVE